jgi:transposase
METRRKFDQQFREGAVRIVRETGKPIAQVARELGIHQGTLGRWVNGDRRARRAVRAGSTRVSARSSSAYARKTPNWRWSAMSSSARSPSGSRKRCGGVVPVNLTPKHCLGRIPPAEAEAEYCARLRAGKHTGHT